MVRGISSCVLSHCAYVDGSEDRDLGQGTGPKLGVILALERNRPVYLGLRAWGVMGTLFRYMVYENVLQSWTTRDMVSTAKSTLLTSCNTGREDG